MIDAKPKCKQRGGTCEVPKGSINVDHFYGGYIGPRTTKDTRRITSDTAFTAQAVTVSCTHCGTPLRVTVTPHYGATVRIERVQP